MTVLRKDEDGAEFLADMRSKIGKQAHAFDRYRRDGDIAIMRTYDGLEGSSTWKVHSVDADHSELTLEGTVTVPLLKGLAMKPFLKRMVHRMDFTPFIQGHNVVRMRPRLTSHASGNRPDLRRASGALARPAAHFRESSSAGASGRG